MGRLITVLQTIVAKSLILSVLSGTVGLYVLDTVEPCQHPCVSWIALRRDGVGMTVIEEIRKPARRQKQYYQMVLRGGSYDPESESQAAKAGDAASEPDSYFETSTDSAVKRGEIARPPWGFMSEVTPTGPLHEQYKYEAEGKSPPPYDSDKHNHDRSGDIGIVWTQYAPEEPRPSGLPSGLDAMRLKSPIVDSSPDTSSMDPIDAWLGRPGMIFVDELLPGSPAHACGLIEKGDKLVGLRVREGDYIEMTAWPMRNAIEAIVGQVDEPVQLRLQRPWTRASKRRLRQRQRRWENLMQDDAQIRRGLEIASGARGRDFLDELEEESDIDKVRYEYVDVVLVRKPRYMFEAIANGTAAENERRFNSSGPLLYALAAEAIRRSNEHAWTRRPIWAPDPAAASAGSNDSCATVALRASFDAAAESGRGIVLPAGEYNLGEKDLRVMDACGGEVNTHIHIRGAGAEEYSIFGDLNCTTNKANDPQHRATAMSTLCGRCVLGTSMPWPTQVLGHNSGWEIPDEDEADPLHPWIRLPLLCNAGGTVDGVCFAGDRAGSSCLVVLNGMWQVSRCRLETRHARGKVVSVTDEAVLALVDAEVAGGCLYGVCADRRAAVVMERVAVHGIETGMMVIDDAAALCWRCEFVGCNTAVLIGDGAEVRAHACAWAGNDYAVSARVLSCTGGVEHTVNEFATLEMVGCRVQGRLWREDQGTVWRVRCFVDVGNQFCA